MDSKLPIRAGQELTIRRIAPQDQRGSRVYEIMKALNWSPHSIRSAWVTYVDASGVSIHINHSDERRRPPEKVIEAFFPNSQRWNAYFEPLRTINRSYILSKHFDKQFPKDLLVT